MKNFKLFFLSAAVLAFASCTKEGDRGPAGPAGPAGEDANFTTEELTVAAADFDGGTYVEYPSEVITQEVYDEGMAIAYVLDDFEYWNSIPSQWHEITGFSYTTGTAGFDAVDGITVDYTVRIVTMRSAQYEEVIELGLEKDCDALIAYLESAK